jgi:hypothetical protein
MPLDQRALAYLGLCWRLLGDPRDAELNDYDNLVSVYELPAPPGYPQIASLNDRLAKLLRRLHFAKRHPPEQTGRGGTQTTGDILSRPEPEIRALVASLKSCIVHYTENLPSGIGHPLVARRGEGFDFSASWSVKLRRKGYHQMHVHPRGWLSAVYYVRVPDAVARWERTGGGLTFGTPDIDLGEEGAARRCIQPAAGRLVIFPSYMWHGTVPLETDGTRLTIAFDVVS